MFAAVWINKFAHAQRHREPLAESLRNLADDSKESVHWEPVLNKNRFSIPIPSQGWQSFISFIASTKHKINIRENQAQNNKQNDRN